MLLLALQIALAAVIGGSWVGGTTYAAKRLGSGTAGLIGGLPSISAVSYLFIGLNQSADHAARAAYAFPVGLSITFVYLLVYVLFADRGFWVAFSAALLSWVILATLGATVNIASLVSPSLIVIPVFLIALYMLRFRLDLPYIQGVPVKQTRTEFFRRAILGGSVVGMAVTLSQLGGPLLGGVAAAFPGIFSTTIYSTYESEPVRSEGVRISRALTKPLMLSAMIVSYPYSLIVSWSYDTFGLAMGTIVAFAGALLFAFLAYLLISRRAI